MADASAGNISISLSLNLAPLEAGVQQANKKLGSISGFLEKEFAKAGGSLGQFGEQIGNIGKNVAKMFGSDAPKFMQAFGKDIEKALGLTDAQVKGLAQSVEALEGAFKAVGTAVKMMTAPLGLALLAAMGVLATYGAIRKAMGAGGVSDSLNKPGGALNTIDQAGMSLPGSGLIKTAMDYYGGGFGKDAKQAGSVAESISKIDPVKDVMSGLESAFEGLLGPLDKFKKYFEMFTEAGSKPEKAKKGASEQEKMDAEARKDYRDWLKKSAEDAKKAAEQQQKDIIEYNQMFVDTAEWNAEQTAEVEKKKIEWLSKINDDVIAIAEREGQKVMARWSALGSGQLGTAFGGTGLGGAVGNIIGGAAVSQSKYLGSALSGASQGSVAGPIGAVVGALVGLMTQSREFGAIMKSVDVILEAVVTALGKVLSGLQNLFDSLEGLAGLFDVLGSIIGVLVQFDLGMQAVTALFKAIGQIDFSGASKWFDGVGQEISEFFAGAPGVGLNASQADRAANDVELTAWRERVKAAKEAAEWDRDLAKMRSTDSTDFSKTMRDARLSMTLMGDAAYQAGAKGAYFAKSMEAFGQSVIDSKNLLDMYNSAAGAEGYIESQIAAAKADAKKAELDLIVADRLEALGLATDRAKDSLQMFSDSLINAAPGFRLAAAGYNATDYERPTTYSNSNGGGGGGGGNVTVYIGGEQVAAVVERQQERGEMLGASRATRGSMLGGG